MKCAAVVLAAGQGKRMKSKVKKQFLDLDGKPILYYALNCFEQAPFIQEIVLVTGEDSVTYCWEEIVQKYGFSKVSRIVVGGKERYDSVYAGLLACEGCDYVYIHDGARPFVDQEILERALREVKICGACAVGVPSKDTIKILDRQNYVADTPDRNLTWSVQTPQVFAYPLIRKAHEELRGGDMTGITDDAMVVERQGSCRVKMVEGSYENIKITTPEDMAVAEIIWKKHVFEKN